MTPLFIRLLLSAVLSAAAAPVVVDASYDLLMPSDWAMDRRGGGAVFTGPAAEGVSALISVRYVRPDHSLYGTAEAYMKRLTRPSSIPLKGWKDGPVEKVSVVGRKALRLERDTTEFTAPHTIAPKEVAMREEHIAVPAAQGFYLLIYTAPRSIDKTLRPVFRGLVQKGFKPKL